MFYAPQLLRNLADLIESENPQLPSLEQCNELAAIRARCLASHDVPGAPTIDGDDSNAEGGFPRIFWNDEDEHDSKFEIERDGAPVGDTSGNEFVMQGSADYNGVYRIRKVRLVTNNTSEWSAPYTISHLGQ